MPQAPAEAPNNTKIEALASVMTRIGRRLTNTVARAVETEGETLIVSRLLGIIGRFGPMTQQEIANFTAQHPAGVSRLVDELEHRNLVRRIRDSEDRRKVRVEHTDSGRALYLRLEPRLFGAIDKVLAPLDENDRATILALLEKVLDSGESP